MKISKTGTYQQRIMIKCLNINNILNKTGHPTRMPMKDRRACKILWFDHFNYDCCQIETNTLQ